MEKSKAWEKYISSVIKNNLTRLSPIFIFILLFISLSIFNQRFLTLITIRNLMAQASTIGVVALGAMLVIISGGIDFSAGYGLAMIVMAAGAIYSISNSTQGIWVMIAVTVICGALLGLTNGLIINGLKIVPFIATFGTMSIAKGLSLLIGRGATVLITNERLRQLGQGNLFGFIPITFMVFMLISFLMYILLNHTKLGNYAFAIGTDEKVVQNVGINTNLFKLLIYIVAGICTGIGALLTITRIGMVSPNIYGSVLLDAIAAVVIGGIPITGGEGNVSGVILGVFIIVIISMALTYLNISPVMQEFFKGSLILVAIGGDAYIRSLAQKKAFNR